MTNQINMKKSIVTLLILLVPSSLNAANVKYPIVDTGQSGCYSNSRSISCPEAGANFNGQDAQYHLLQPSYQDNGNGTVTDLNTGLIWQKKPAKEKSYYQTAKKNANSFQLTGYDDWRLPTVKELYSLIDFRGQSSRGTSDSIPYINTDYFDFYYGNTSKGERLIDAQYWTATEYTGTTMNGNSTTFGVNFADGRIKGYPNSSGNSRNKRFVRYVRGNPDYGQNQFADNGNSTITDSATGLTWMQVDSGKTMNWPQALDYAENSTHAGFNDWRLPNAKELQSIIDYSKSPQATNPAHRGLSIDPLFYMSDGDGWFWTSTTHLEHGSARQAVYLCFGQGWGYMAKRGSSQKRRMDVHGAGAQRSEHKTGNPDDYSQGRGPQGDEIRIYNYVRLVRGGNVIKDNTQPKAKGNYEINADRSSKISASSQKQRPQQKTGNNRQDGAYNKQSRGKQNQGPPPNMMEHLDKDGDYRISRNEFPGPPQHFNRLDKDGDGYLSKDELPKGPPPKRQTN